MDKVKSKLKDQTYGILKRRFRTPLHIHAEVTVLDIRDCYLDACKFMQHNTRT